MSGTILRRSWRLGAAICLLLGLAATGCAKKPDLAAEEAHRKKVLAHYNLGIDHLRNGREPMAIRELKQAEAVDPEDKWTQLALAEAYRRQGRLELSVENLNRALAIDPTMNSARLSLSGVYIQMERYPEAAREAQILLDDPVFGTPWRAYTNLGWAQFRMGDVDSARRNLGYALDFDENYWPAMLNLGILENAAGGRLEAIRLFTEMLAVQPSPPPPAVAEANYRLAEIYIALGQQERAVSFLTAAAASKPGGTWGRKSEEYLKLLR